MRTSRYQAKRVAGVARVLGGVVTIAASSSIALDLAACGTSTSHANASARNSADGASASGRGSGEACLRVSAPTPKGAQHVPRPTRALDPAQHYVVTLMTNCGVIAIQLDVKQAPKTASSFAYLVRRGFYNDLTFHRVAADFVIQGGDPNGDGSGGPGYTIVERPPEDLHYTRGTVAMAKTSTDPPGASGSQFFIVTAREAELPAQYALVGKVVGSMAGVNAIARLPTIPPQDGAPTRPVVISSATLSQS